MNRSSVTKQLQSGLLAVSLMLGGALSAAAQTAPAVSPAAAPQAAKDAASGVQSANIFSIAPDANTDPKYA
ncbi:MAG: Formate dehydrogenase, cytochrome b556(fdo) subunit, partial [Pseudomonadota bacterium]